MRGSTNQLEGEFTVFDPADPQPFIAAAGTRLLRVEDGKAVVRNGDGTESYAYPGWLAFRPDGSGPDSAVFTTPDLVSSGTGTVYRVEQA
jgi:hypothetical protein